MDFETLFKLVGYNYNMNLRQVMHLKKIPIGISDFKTIIEEGYLFVDKTLLIKEFWESNGQTILLPRPRRFGKTLNMSMIKYFFENASIDNSYLFEKLNIENHK